MGNEFSPKDIPLTKEQFIKALRVTIVKALISEGQEATGENIELFEERAKNNWVKMPDGREFRQWDIVLHDAAKLSIAMARK